MKKLVLLAIILLLSTVSFSQGTPGVSGEGYVTQFVELSGGWLGARATFGFQAVILEAQAETFIMGNHRVGAGFSGGLGYATRGWFNLFFHFRLGLSEFKDEHMGAYIGTSFKYSAFIYKQEVALFLDVGLIGDSQKQTTEHLLLGIQYHF